MMHALISKRVQKIPNISGYEDWVVAAISSIVALIHKLFTKTSSYLDDILIRHNRENRFSYVESWAGGIQQRNYASMGK